MLLVDYESPDLESLMADEATLGKVLAALESLDALPVRYLVNTHWHSDHVGGKSELAGRATVEELASRQLPEPWESAWPADPEMRRRRIEALHRSLRESPPTDSDRLLALHRQVMEAHLGGDVEMLLAAESADSIVVSGGEIHRPDIEARREQFDGYLGATDFATYRDLVEPIVTVSEDGTLGWVIARVEAAGEQTRRDGTSSELAFVSAWIELYEKRDGEWVRVGNVSNFAPR